MKLAIVIVHYNTSADLARCLESLVANRPACDYRVVVVDNASQDPGLAAVQQRFSDCHWIFNTENAGYSRGVNIGLASLKAEYYLVLNPDIVVQPGALDQLLGFADGHPKAGLIGPQLLNEDGTLQDSCRRFYTFNTLLLRRTFLGRIFKNSRTVDRHLMRDFDHRSPRPVDWVLGGCILVRHEAIQRTGPMDERFFLYFEDVDWCYRMWQAGWEVLYTPDARFLHRHRRDSAKGALSKSFWLHLGSLISFYEKWGVLVYLLKKWRGPLVVFLLWCLDMVALGSSFLCAYGLRTLGNRFFPEALFPLAEYRPMVLFAGLLASLTFLLSGRYRLSRHRRVTAPLRHLQQIGYVALLLLASSYLGHQEVISRAVLLLFVGLLAIFTALGEELFMTLRRRMERGYLSLERTLFVGAPAVIENWLEQVPDLRTLGIDVVGYVETAPDTRAQAPPPIRGGEVPWCGTWAEIPEIVQRYRISQVVFWEQPLLEKVSYRVLAWLRRRRIQLRWRIDEVWLLAAGARADVFGGQVSGVLEPDAGSLWRSLGLRLIDLVTGVILAIAGFGPWLWLRIWAQRKGTVSVLDLACRGRWDDHHEVTLIVSRSGKVLPLWCQVFLIGPIFRGRLSLWGSRLYLEGPDQTHYDPREAVAFWRTRLQQPGLTGSWAVEQQKACSTGESNAGQEYGRVSLRETGRLIINLLRELVVNPAGFDHIQTTRGDTAFDAQSRSDGEVHPQ